MTDSHPQRTRVEDLLSQDAAVSSFQFEEFRRNLEASIRRLEQRARTIRRASLWSFGAYLACILAVLPMEIFGLSKYKWIPPFWSGCGLVAMFATGVFAGIYFYKYRPALKQARYDLQLTMIAELQQQVADLRRQLDGQ